MCAIWFSHIRDFLIECWLNLYVRIMSVYIEKLRKEWATWACGAWIGFVIQANYGQEFLFLNEGVTGVSILNEGVTRVSTPNGTAGVTGVSTPNGESYGSFYSWWREFLLWASLPFLTLDLLRMAVPALLLGYKIKGRQHLVSCLSYVRSTSTFPLRPSLPVLVPASTGYRESRPPKPSFASSSARVKTDNQVFGERLRDRSIVQQPHILPGVRGGNGKIGAATSLRCIEWDDYFNIRYVD